jgi:hypothetical protein
MSMVWEHVPKMQPKTGLMFVPHMTYEHGETSWNGINTGKVINPPDVSGNPTSNQQVVK